jgi:flavin-dependent dehydrogenase
MKEVTVIGAGISGLVAAISLARGGHEVKVLEREDRIGGMPEFRPDPAGSPFDIEGVKRFTGIDIEPAAKLLDEAYVIAWGRRFSMPMRADIGMYMVERGSRSTSLDSLLLTEALELGVNVEFGHPVITQGEYAALPPDSIISTGLKIEPYEALNIPYSPLYGYFAKGNAGHDRTTVSLWMDTFTRDYAFNCTINGISFALLFQRDIPLTREGKEKFTVMLAEHEGLEFDRWNDLMGGACPVGSIRNPRLFHGNKILAGTFAGVIDPFLFFGMLGALVTGRIAARAIEDKAEAYYQFRKAVATFYPTYVLKKIWNLLPTFIKRPLVRAGFTALPVVENHAMRRFACNIPGWRLTQ